MRIQLCVLVVRINYIKDKTVYNEHCTVCTLSSRILSMLSSFLICNRVQNKIFARWRSVLKVHENRRRTTDSGQSTMSVWCGAWPTEKNVGEVVTPDKAAKLLWPPLIYRQTTNQPQCRKLSKSALSLHNADVLSWQFRYISPHTTTTRRLN